MKIKSPDELSFMSDYWQDDDLRKTFISFIKDIFRADFTAWDKSGFWDREDYRPFSYFDGSKLVANVCVYKMPAIVHGRSTVVAQISSVATLPEYRLHGLNRQLHQSALNWAKERYEFVFLFSADNAIPFYQKIGFRPVPDFAPTLIVGHHEKKPGMEKLNLNDPTLLQHLYDLCFVREPISNDFSNLNPKLVLFHALFSLKDHGYWIPELKTIIFWKRESEKVIIYDLIARKLPSFEELLPYLGLEKGVKLLFRFSVDKLRVSTELEELHGNHAHVMGEAFMLNPFIFPYTAMA